MSNARRRISSTRNMWWLSAQMDSAISFAHSITWSHRIKVVSRLMLASVRGPGVVVTIMRAESWEKSHIDSNWQSSSRAAKIRMVHSEAIRTPGLTGAYIYNSFGILNLRTPPICLR